MKKTILVILISILLFLVFLCGCFGENKNGVQNGDLWEKVIDFNGSDDIPLSLKTDSQGNLYVVGYCYGGPSSNAWDWWLKKFDSNGVEDLENWNKKLGSSGDDEAISVVIDDNDNVYVSGFWTGVGTTHVDWWIKKFDSNGIEDLENWNKTFDGNGHTDWLFSSTIDKDNNLYVVGEIGGVGFYVGESDDGFLPTTRSKDLMWLKKFDSNGVENIENWNKTVEKGEVYTQGYSITTDSNANVYVIVAYGKDNTTYGLMKYNQDGILLDETSFADNVNVSFEEPSAISVDSNDNVYVVGRIIKDGDTKNADWMIKKFDSYFNEDTSIWNKTFDGNNSYDIATCIAIDSLDNIYVGGVGTNILGNTNRDYWIKKFDSEGNEIWDKRYDYNYTKNYLFSIDVDDSGHVFVAGYGEDLLGSTYHDWWVKRIV